MLIEHSKKSVGRFISTLVKPGQLFTDPVLLSAEAITADFSSLPAAPFVLQAAGSASLRAVSGLLCGGFCKSYFGRKHWRVLSLEVITLGIDRAYQRITQNFAELHNSPLEQITIITPIFFSNMNVDLLLCLMGCSV